MTYHPTHLPLSCQNRAMSPYARGARGVRHNVEALYEWVNAIARAHGAVA